jgi:hypothetical protein
LHSGQLKYWKSKTELTCQGFLFGPFNSVFVRLGLFSAILSNGVDLISLCLLSFSQESTSSITSMSGFSSGAGGGAWGIQGLLGGAIASVPWAEGGAWPGNAIMLTFSPGLIDSDLTLCWIKESAGMGKGLGKGSILACLLIDKC